MFFKLFSFLILLSFSQISNSNNDIQVLTNINGVILEKIFEGQSEFFLSNEKETLKLEFKQQGLSIDAEALKSNFEVSVIGFRKILGQESVFTVEAISVLSKTMQEDNFYKSKGYLHQDALLVDDKTSGYALEISNGRVYDLIFKDENIESKIIENLNSYVVVYGEFKKIIGTKRRGLFVHDIDILKKYPKASTEIVGTILFEQNSSEHKILSTDGREYKIDFSNVIFDKIEYDSYSYLSWFYEYEFNREHWDYFFRMATLTQGKYYNLIYPSNSNVRLVGELENNLFKLHSFRFDGFSLYIEVLEPGFEPGDLIFLEKTVFTSYGTNIHQSGDTANLLRFMSSFVEGSIDFYIGSYIIIEGVDIVSSYLDSNRKISLVHRFKVLDDEF